MEKARGKLATANAAHATATAANAAQKTGLRNMAYSVGANGVAIARYSGA